MRIIAGEFRGRVLKNPADLRTRPTSDRLRETLFNILNPRINDDTRFLDLCAGTGAIGIEAISRGARFVTFIDKSQRACALVEENLDLLKIPEDQTEIFRVSAEKFITHQHSAVWNIIFYDPPYQENYKAFLFEFAANAENLLSNDGVFIAEHHSKTALPETVEKVIKRRILKQGESQLSFYERNG